MAVVHQNFVDLAKRLIDKNGRTVKLKKETRTPTDPTEPWSTDTVSSAFATTKGLFVSDDSKDLVLALRALGVGGQGSEAPTVLAGRGNKVLVPAKGLSFAPDMSHKLVDGDTEWEIAGVEKLQPGPTVILYTLTLGN